MKVQSRELRPLCRGLAGGLAGGLICALVFTAPAGADGSGPGPIWTHSSGTEGWQPRAVSIGNRGTQVFAQVGPLVDYTRLLSAHDAHPPTPVWTQTSPQWTYEHRVDSASEANVHVSMHKSFASGTSGPKRPILRKFTSASPSPAWQYTFLTDHYGAEGADVAVSRDGQVIAAVVYDPGAGFLTRVAIFGPDSPVPLSNTLVDTFGSHSRMLLSADGSTLYIWATYRLTVFDVASAQVAWALTVFDGIRQGHGLSGDGSILSFGAGSALRVYRRDANGAYSLAHEHVLPSGWRCDAIAVSEDGSTLAAGANHSDNSTVRLFALDLASYQESMSYQTSGAGALANLVSSIAIAANGATFVAGLWGDETGTVPELFFFDSRASTPLGSHDLPGSVFAVDLSPDGRNAVVASKAVHANVFGFGGQISLFEARAVDFRMCGVPEAGRSVQFELHAASPHSAILLMSPSTAVFPEAFPGAGTLYLNRAQLSTLAMSPIGPDGVATRTFQIPGSALVGSSLYFQGVSSSPRRLSADWVQLTVLP